MLRVLLASAPLLSMLAAVGPWGVFPCGPEMSSSTRAGWSLSGVPGGVYNPPPVLYSGISPMHSVDPFHLDSLDTGRLACVGSGPKPEPVRARLVTHPPDV